MLELRPEEFAALPYRVTPHGLKSGAVDVWLTAKQCTREGLLWLFECPHGRWLLVGGRTTIHGEWKKKWNQGALLFPSEHRDCPHHLYGGSQWTLVVDDPLSYIAPPVTYKCHKSFWGFIAHAVLKKRFDNFEAILFIAPDSRVARVAFRFDVIEKAWGISAWRPCFSVDYNIAVQHFEQLLPSLQPHCELCLAPHDALTILKK